MKIKIQNLKNNADKAKALYAYGKITREQAREQIKPYITEFNSGQLKLSKKFGMKAKTISDIGYLR